MFLSALDIFPNRVDLNVKSNSQYQTNTGAILTVVVAAITILQSITTFSAIFQYQSPSVTTQRTYNRAPGSIGLNDSNFVFALKVNDPMYNLSRSYVSFTLEVKSIIRHANGSLAMGGKQIPLERCSKEYLKGFEAEYVALGLQNAVCPSSGDYDINGTFLSDNFTFISIYVKTCQNDTTQPDIICQPIEQIRSKMSGNLRVQLFYSDNQLMPSNHSHPYSRFINEIYWDTNPNFSMVQTDVMVNEQELISNDFLWWSGFNVKTQRTYGIDLAEIRTNYQKLVVTNPDKFNIMQLMMKRSNYVYTTTREYETVFSGLSAIGGISSLAIGILGVIAAMYSRNAYLISIANEMYEFELPESLSKNKKKPSKSRFCCCFRKKKPKTELPFSNSPSAEMNPKREMVAQYYIQQAAARKKVTLAYGFLDFLRGLICCRRGVKDKIIKRVIETVTRDTDVLNLIKGSYENERLKKVLLTKEQHNLLTQPCYPTVMTSDLWENNKKSSGRLPKSVSMREEKGAPGRKRGRFEEAKAKAKEEIHPLSQKEREYREFMTLFKSYQKVFRESKDPVNFKILELLDANLHEALYEMSKNVKGDSMDSCDDDATPTTVHRTVLLHKKNPIQYKLEAATKIALRLQSRFKERKKNSISSPTAGGGFSPTIGGRSPSDSQISIGTRYFGGEEIDSAPEIPSMFMHRNHLQTPKPGASRILELKDLTLEEQPKQGRTHPNSQGQETFD